MNLAKKAGKIKHYLLESNPFKTIDSISKLIDDHLYLTDNKDLVILNKPPGLVLADKHKDNKNFIDIINENIKSKLNWSKALRIPIVTDDQAGIFMYASNTETFNLTRKTMIAMFPSQHIPYLKFYGITTFIPVKQKGSHLIQVKHENIHNDLLYFEPELLTKNSLKYNKVLSYQIEHEVVDSCKELNVALVRYTTGWHNGDGILYYSMKNLFPLLGDHRYSPRVKTIFGKPVLVPNQYEHKPEPQKLNDSVINALKINDYLRDIVPLHLQLYEINLEKKFAKQKIIFKKEVPIQSYFTETVKNLLLKFPQKNLELNSK